MTQLEAKELCFLSEKAGKEINCRFPSKRNAKDCHGEASGHTCAKLLNNIMGPVRDTRSRGEKDAILLHREAAKERHDLWEKSQRMKRMRR